MSLQQWKIGRPVCRFSDKEAFTVSYTAADITELDDVQHTRLRPAVNLGQEVLLTALRELVDNAVEEVAVPSNGGSTVTITLHADTSVTVTDDGRGLPVDTDPVTKKNGIVKTLGTARAGGKFSAHTDAASTGAGLNGIGAAAAVFISARTDVIVMRDGKTYKQSFGKGYPGTFTGKDFDPNAEFVRDDTQKLRGAANRKPDAHGTSVRILFDPTVAPDCVIDIGEVLLRAHAAARMCFGVHLRVIDEGWPIGEVPEMLTQPFDGPWGTDALLTLMCAAARHPRTRRSAWWSRAPVPTPPAGDRRRCAGRWRPVPPSRPPWPGSATRCAPPTAARICPRR